MSSKSIVGGNDLLIIGSQDSTEPNQIWPCNLCNDPNKLEFHHVMGCDTFNRNVFDGSTWYKRCNHFAESDGFGSSFVFSSRPIQINEVIVLQIIEIEQRASGSLSIGFTSCDPSLLTENHIRLTRNELIETNSYVWLVEHDVFDKAVPNDTIKIRIDGYYNVLIKLSNQPEKIIMNVFFGETSPLYLFIDLFGRTTGIRIMNFQIENSDNFHSSGNASIVLGSETTAVPNQSVCDCPLCTSSGETIGSIGLGSSTINGPVTTTVVSAPSNSNPSMNAILGSRTISDSATTTAVNSESECGCLLCVANLRIGLSTGTINNCVTTGTINNCVTTGTINSCVTTGDSGGPSTSFEIGTKRKSDCTITNCLKKTCPDSDEPLTPYNACIICLSVSADMVYAPCQHICVCQSCDTKSRRNIKDCPLCRKKIRTRTKVYMANA